MTRWRKGADAIADRPRDDGLVLHASCVVTTGGGALIRGQSGSGKSVLALRLLALGARLVADDRTHLRRERGRLVAEAPAAIRGLIEARGIGILNAPPVTDPAPVALIVDLDRQETERLPPVRQTRLLGVDLPVIGNPGGLHLPAAILIYLAHGRHA